MLLPVSPPPRLVDIGLVDIRFRSVWSETPGSSMAPPPSADLQQAEYFWRILDSRKAEVCERLEAEFDALARVNRAGCLEGSRRHRRAVKTLEAELRTLDRMLVALRVELGLPTLRRNTTCRAPSTNRRCSS